MSQPTRDDFDRLIPPCYAPADFVPVRGLGSRLWDQAGREYIDFAGGIAVTALGHAHPALIAALTEQAGKLWHVSNTLTNEPALLLARRLTQLTFAERVFFSNSGAEANEAALKLARRVAFDKAGEEKFGIVACRNAFHGRTFFTVSVGGQEKYSAGFGPKPAGITHIPYNDVAALRAAVSSKTCAVIFEPILGESGVVAASAAFLQAAREVCDAHDALLIFDEVQTGMGRTGSLFYYQQTGVVPDILTSAKGLGGGFPIGAMLTRTELAQHFTLGAHGSTFGGNPLACAVALAALNGIADPALLAGVQARHEILTQGLRRINERLGCFAEVRGKGLLIGCELSKTFAGKSRDFVRAGHAAGVIFLVAGPDVLRLAPALNIPEADLQEGLARIERALLSVMQ